MDSILNLLVSEKRHWLITPRLASVIWPAALGSLLASAGYQIACLPFLTFSAVAALRLTFFRLLPHEKKLLTCAHRSRMSAEPEAALTTLHKYAFIQGTHFKLQKAIILAKSYCDLNRFRQAHQTLNAVDRRPLLVDERDQLAKAWARLFYDAGNSLEAKRRIEHLTKDHCLADPELLLLKSMIFIAENQLPEARELLEAGLDQQYDAERRMLLLNNLAVVEAHSNHPESQKRHLEAALRLFRSSPYPYLTHTLHHNVAMARARSGDAKGARDVLREAFNAGNTASLTHVLEVLNNCLHAARELADPNWIKEIYHEFDVQLDRLRPLTPAQQLALDVSEFRMRRNDGLSFEPQRYVEQVERCLMQLEAPGLAIPVEDRIGWLCALHHDLEREMQSRMPTGNISTVIGLRIRVGSILRDQSSIINTYLTQLSPLLSNPIDAWHRMQITADRAEIILAQDNDVRDAFGQLFTHLKEHAELLSERGPLHKAIEKWLTICDEYVTYGSQFPPIGQARWRQDYGELANTALEQAAGLMQQLKITNQHLDLLIGLAHFALLLKNDTGRARNWINIVNAFKPTLEHYAMHVRVEYATVTQWLQNASTDPKTTAREMPT